MLADVTLRRYDLPEEILIAQRAVHLPEVQEMMRKLAQYNLGVCMPHAHEDVTGRFIPLPADDMQVEAGLEVSFFPKDHIARNDAYYLPVGWYWRDGTASVSAACASVCEFHGPTDTNHYNKHERT